MEELNNRARETARIFAPIIAGKLANYDMILYSRGEARKGHLECIEMAYKLANKTSIVLGYAHMGGINDVTKVIPEVSIGNFENIKKIHHVHFYQNIHKSP